MRSKGYWRSYHASKANEKRQVFGLCKQVAKKLGPPWQVSGRGRPPDHMPEEYAAVAIYRKHFHMVLRVMEGDTPFVLGRRMDHSTIWWGLQRIPVEYVDRAIQLLFGLTVALFPPDIFIPDATGVQTDRYRKRKRPKLRPKGKPPPKWRRGREKRPPEERELVTLKLHLLIGYCKEAGLLPILRARVTRGHAHDSPQLKPMVGKIKGEGEPFLADKEYDSNDNYVLVKKHGFVPVIKLREGTFRGWVRQEMTRSFKLHKKIYKYRGLIEGVFGGTETKYGNRTKCRCHGSRRIDCLLMVVSHNLRTYMRTLALKRLKIFILVGFIRQPPRNDAPKRTRTKVPLSSRTKRKTLVLID